MNAELIDAPQALTTDEEEQLARCESEIEKGMAQVWLTLAHIYESKLYRAYGQWEDYCKARWGREKSRAYQWLDASRVYIALNSQSTNGGLQLPTSERQMRPLAALPPDEMLDVWQAALEKASGTTPSGALVEQAIKERISIKAPVIEATVVTPTAEATQVMGDPITIDVEPLVAQDAESDGAPSEENIIPLTISDAIRRQIDEAELFFTMASMCKSMARDLGDKIAAQVYIVVHDALVTLLPGPQPPDQTPPILLLAPAPTRLLLPPPPKQEVEPDYVERYIRVSLDNILIKQIEVDQDITAAIKEVPGRKYDPDTQTWSVPLSSASYALALAQNFDFFLAQHDEAILSNAANLRREQTQQKQAATQAEKEARRLETERRKSEKLKARYDASRATEAELEVPGLGGELYPYQKAGVKYLRDTKCAILGDEMGLGKTPQALAALQVARAYPALIISPASVRPNWRKEAEKWLPGRTICYLSSGKSEVTEADITIVNYDLLTSHKTALLARDWKALIVDESHYIKGYKTDRYKNVLELAEGVRYRFLLSGTAITNNTIELVTQLRVLGVLVRVFGGFYKFAGRYRGAANLDELNQKLRQHCYVRRLKRDVLPSLPPKRRLTQWVEIDTSAEYKKAESDLVSYVRDRAEKKLGFLASISHLTKEEQQEAKKARGDDAAQKAARGELLVLISKLRQIAGRGKIAVAKTWIKEYLEQVGAKLVVFAWHEGIISAIVEAFGALCITGDIPTEKRQIAVERFQSDPSCRVIVCNIRAGGQGITLTSAATTCFIELDWTPAMLRQAEDRIHRIGQEAEVVENYYLLADVSIDKYMGRLVAAKAEIVDAALDGASQDENEKEEAEASGFVDWLMDQQEKTL